jgi:hypothetical protein
MRIQAFLQNAVKIDRAHNSFVHGCEHLDIVDGIEGQNVSGPRDGTGRRWFPGRLPGVFVEKVEVRDLTEKSEGAITG